LKSQKIHVSPRKLTSIKNAYNRNVTQTLQNITPKHFYPN